MDPVTKMKKAHALERFFFESIFITLFLLLVYDMAAKQPIISAEDLKDVLECPVCLKVPRCAPIFQCERGHVVCNECHPKLVTCPVCRLPLGNTRSLISEKVLAR